MLFLVDSGGAWNHLQGMIKPKAWRGYLQEVYPWQGPTVLLFSLSDAKSTLRQGRAMIYISDALDLHCMHTQSFTVIFTSQIGTPSVADSTKMLSKSSPKNMLKYISSMTVWLRCLLWDNCLFLLIWGADGKQASVRQAFWDDSHEIPPQVPLEPL